MALSITALTQSFYEQGTSYLQNGDFVKADSTLTLAIESMPFRDAFYNRAIARMQLNNMSGFCIDIKKAASLNDEEAEKLHTQFCLDIDTVYYSESFQRVDENPHLMEVIKKEKFYDLTEGHFYDMTENEVARYRIQNEHKWYGLVPKMPKFIGKEKTLQRFLQKNLKYPENEKDAYQKYPGNYTTVYIQYDIDTIGKVCNVIVLEERKEHTYKHISENFINEAIRVIESMPDFKPALFMNKPVNVRNSIPITFTFPR
ncbi:hypothetical protein SAMN03080601_03567 [Alkalitalea saponilacus]|uniref:TonB protein C-terminal n=2 Tax=Alkalitalea saponilacus TaxID=889453 RepID=A0A1T5HUR6_9BACT|nr:hypothetical protein SAMN03080601_03567 [Alkalitalea saponilacus]